jgi:hypothetical protein
MGLFDIFKKKSAVTPAVEYVHQVIRTLTWWLLVLEEDAGRLARNERILNAALTSFGSGTAVTTTAYQISRVIAGETLYRAPERVQSELLTFLDAPGGWESITRSKATAAVVELMNGLDEIVTDKALRDSMRSQTIKTRSLEHLSPEANVLYVGTLHLLERALAAYVAENASKERRKDITTLFFECNYALNGFDIDTRAEMHRRRELEQLNDDDSQT